MYLLSESSVQGQSDQITLAGVHSLLDTGQAYELSLLAGYGSPNTRVALENHWREFRLSFREFVFLIQ